MRIAHCITGLTGDGAQRMLLRLVERLQERGTQNYVVSLSRREPLADAFEGVGVPVRCVDMNGISGRVAGLPRLRRVMNELRPDLSQGWMYHSNLALSLVQPARSISTPIVWNIRRGLDDYQERKRVTRLVIQSNRALSSRPSGIIYCTGESRVQHEAFGFHSARGVVIGNGFDTDTFAPSAEKRRRVRERLGVRDGEVLIGNIGRDDTAKGRQFLFEAFARVLRSFPCARLLVIGRGMSEENPALRRTLARLQIASRVILAGECSPISGLYPAMDIVCSSSVNEGFPNVVAEALSSGVPCVATDAGNARELLEGNGLVVPSRSAESLSRALLRMCAESEGDRMARGARARRKIVERFSLAQVTDTYLNLYQRLVAGEVLESPSQSGPSRRATSVSSSSM